MRAWDIYEERRSASGSTKRETYLKREQRDVKRLSKDILSYHDVTIDGVEQRVDIINTDNLDEKFIYALPGEHIRHGGLVFWFDNYWLITEVDANAEVYEKGKMIQCNYNLRWVDESGEIHEQWCIIEDGTKLRVLVSVQSNLHVKISIELLETPKAYITTTQHRKM